MSRTRDYLLLLKVRPNFLARVRKKPAVLDFDFGLGFGFGFDFELVVFCL